MAKTQDIKRRIRSISNTKQLTRAMKMVSGAKLRRAQERMEKARPYAHRMRYLLSSLASRANPEAHPLLQTHEGGATELVVLTGDRGLCGSFNASILRTAQTFADEQLSGTEVRWTAVGKRGRDYLTRRYELTDRWIDIFREVDASTASEIAEALMKRYVSHENDAIYLVYNEFKSAIQSRPIVQRLLPVGPIETESHETAEDYIYEPSAGVLYDALLPRYVENQVLQAMLESVAAEHAARKTAMDSATNNAGELIASLTLTMNRVRQASITTEIIEVVSGAEALG
jgi:F-type H+-transporting ATPase subunit gamma